MNFQHTPNNNIRINNGDNSYFDSLVNFQIDYEGDYSGLPEGYREAQVDGERASIYTANSQEPMPEAMLSEVTAIIAALDAIIANQQSREAALE